jgi:hypothetical protein
MDLEDIATPPPLTPASLGSLGTPELLAHLARHSNSSSVVAHALQSLSTRTRTGYAVSELLSWTPAGATAVAGWPVVLRALSANGWDAAIVSTGLCTMGNVWLQVYGTCVLLPAAAAVRPRLPVSDLLVSEDWTGHSSLTLYPPSGQQEWVVV